VEQRNAARSTGEVWRIFRRSKDAESLEKKNVKKDSDRQANGDDAEEKCGNGSCAAEGPGPKTEALRGKEVQKKEGTRGRLKGLSGLTGDV